MEKLEDIVSCSIVEQSTLRCFLKYCKVYCGWTPYSQVDADSVKTCLNNFKKDHPKQAQYVS